MITTEQHNTMSLPTNPSQSFIKRNPHLYPATLYTCRKEEDGTVSVINKEEVLLPRIRKPRAPKPLLNGLETKWCSIIVCRGFTPLKQAITLRLDPPYRSYTADLAYISYDDKLVLVEVKGPHRFRRAGIAKAALAAKTYPCFRFELADWDGKQWTETTL